MLRKTSIKVIGILAITSLGVTGQEINWHSIDQGGGVSSGSGITITGVIGQVESSRLEAGKITVSGGYLPIPADLIFESTFNEGEQ